MMLPSGCYTTIAADFDFKMAGGRLYGATLMKEPLG